VPANAEEALVQLYGRPLYGYFFRDFTHRYWGIPPRELSAAFVRTKMPRLSAVDVVKKALGRVGIAEDKGAAVESAVTDEVLWYSQNGAAEMPLALAEDIVRRGGQLRLGCTVTGLTLVGDEAPAGDNGNGNGRRNGASPGGRRVTGVSYTVGGDTRHEPCDAVLSTIPLAPLVAAIGPAAPEAVRRAGQALRHKPVAVYGFLVRKPRVLDAMYVYYRERIFHRLAEPANCGMQVRPAGHTVLLAETTCDEGDDRWQGGEATRRRIVADLEAEGLLVADDIVETHVLRDEYAYPVMALGFEAHLAAVQGFLDTVPNLRSTGRQGAFCYPNMHGAMRMGADTAEALLATLRPAEVPAAG
jgi:protoporphyrinogen oxidase